MGIKLEHFSNQDNQRTHYATTGPEIRRDTGGRITHFVSAMGTAGTIIAVSHYLNEQNSEIRIIGAQPAEGSSIPGIPKWMDACPPKIFDNMLVDQIENVTHAAA